MTKIVTIGGGTGSFAVLRGLKKYPFDISAVVTMFDSGGSSGVLRDEYGILPPGDLRRCLLALAGEASAPTLRSLFNYRFDKAGSLYGHSFGNLFITALTDIEGDYLKAIDRAAEILHVQGKICPVSLDDAQLCVELEDGTFVRGEANIDNPQHNQQLKITRAFLEPEARAQPRALQAITEADVIVIGPGDLYTSIIPNLLVDGVAAALKASQAKKIYICNLMTKSGETNGFKVSQFAQEILRYATLDKLDYLICNDEVMEESSLQEYARNHQFPVVIDERVAQYARQVVRAQLSAEGNMLRHDSDKLAAVISGLLLPK